MATLKQRMIDLTDVLVLKINTLYTMVTGKEPAFLKNTAFNKNFGTTAGTVAEGNDARLVEAFAKKVNAVSVTGDSNKTITVTREDGSILTASFLDRDTEFPDDVINTLTFNVNDDGVLIAITSEGAVLSVSMDGRYSLIGHIHSISDVTGLQAALTAIQNDLNDYRTNQVGVDFPDYAAQLTTGLNF